MARWLSGDRSAPVEWLMQQAQFPPFYPALLSLLKANSAYSAHCITVSALLLGSICFSFWLHQQKLNRWVQSGLVLFFLLLPSTWMISFELMSEPLYLLLTFLTLLLFTHLEEGSNKYGYRLIILIPLALLLLTRTIGISMVLAMLIVFSKRRYWQGVALVILSCLPALAWRGYKQLVGFDGGYQDALLFGMSDSVGIVEWLIALLSVVKLNVLAMFSSFGNLLSLNAHWLLKGAAWIGVCVAIFGWFQRFKRWKIDAVYLLIYLSILSIWPYPGHMSRFLWPILPLALFYMVSALSVPKRQVGVIALGLVLMVPSSIDIGKRWWQGQQQAETQFTQTKRWFSRQALVDAEQDLRARQDLERLLKRIPQWVPEGECVHFMRPPDAVLFSNRLSLEPPRVFGGRLERLTCYWLVISGFTHPVSPGAFYPLNYLQPRYIRNIYSNKGTIGKAMGSVGGVQALLLEYRPESEFVEEGVN